MPRFSIRNLVVFVSCCACYFAITTRGWLRPLMPLHFAIACLLPVWTWWRVRQKRLEIWPAAFANGLCVATLFFELYYYELRGSMVVLVMLVASCIPMLATKVLRPM